MLIQVVVVDSAALPRPQPQHTNKNQQNTLKKKLFLAGSSLFFRPSLKKYFFSGFAAVLKHINSSFSILTIVVKLLD